MGIRAGFTEITPDAFNQIRVGGEPALAGGQHHSIDKAWHDFHVVFGRQGPPLSLAIAGDCRHPFSPHSLEEFSTGNHDYYVAFMSPRLVREVAEALATLRPPQLQNWYEELRIGQYDCGFYFFGQLKNAYMEAAKCGNALMIVIA